MLHQLAFARLPSAVKDGAQPRLAAPADPARGPVNLTRPVLHARAVLLPLASHDDGPWVRLCWKELPVPAGVLMPREPG